MYEVPADMLANCDRLEGHPNWYCRSTIGQVGDRDVQAYTIDEPTNMPIPEKDLAGNNGDVVILSFA